MDYSALKEALIGLIGFTSDNDDITGWEGTSGLNFNSAHPFITGSMLGAMTHSDDKTVWLRDLIKGHIATCLSLWIAQKTTLSELDTLLEDIALCGKAVSSEDKLASPSHTNSSGLRLITSGNMKRSKVTAIGLCFETNGPKSVTFVMDGVTTSQDFEYATAGYTQWFPVTKSFRSFGKVTHLNSGALDEPSRFWNCSRHVVHKGLLDDKDHDTSNFGINLRVETSCDFTDWLQAKAVHLAPMILYYVGVQLLYLIKTNPEALNSKLTHNYSITDIEFDINGDSRGKDDFSLNGKYKKALKASTFSKASIDSECIRKKRTGVNIKAIGSRRRR